MRKIFLPLLLVALSPVAHSEGVQEVEIDAPLSGWHPAEGEDASFSQSINYPASSVNMADDQNISAQIRGKIKNYAAAGKVQQGRLVVNGASMPQRIDGSFARPYIFTEAATACRSSARMGKADKNAVLLNAGYRNDSCTFTAGSLVGYGQYRSRSPSPCCHARWRTRTVTPC
ncbi:hypothetical protein BANRA_04621 [Escherichia coli]|nr:hypothetical protein BANRA_04621 [Escherichia coli]